MYVREQFLRFCFVMTLMYAGCTTFVVTSCLAQNQDQPTAPAETSLKKFLQNYLRDPRFGEDKARKYFSAVANLSDDEKQEIVVYLTGDSLCGSGGCNTLILKPMGSSFEVVTRIITVHLPIRILPSKTNGWHDLGVWVQGGGILPGYEALLPFDGKSYPRDPKISPARRLHEKVSGKVIVPLTAEGNLLYE